MSDCEGPVSCISPTQAVLHRRGGPRSHAPGVLETGTNNPSSAGRATLARASFVGAAIKKKRSEIGGDYVGVYWGHW